MTLEEQLARMLSGSQYDDLTPELRDVRLRTVLLTDEYNASFGAAPEIREGLLAKLFRQAGTGAYCEPTLRCEFGLNISVGANFYANFDCELLDGGGITIGDNVLLGPRVSIYTTNHAIDPTERAAGACLAAPVSIGDNCWIGGGVTINPGVSIGAGSVIGSGSVVTRSIPAGVVAVGVPCAVRRPITSTDRTGYRPSH